MLFRDLGLSAELLRAVEKQGYDEATPVQQQAIVVSPNSGHLHKPPSQSDTVFAGQKKLTPDCV